MLQVVRTRATTREQQEDHDAFVARVTRTVLDPAFKFPTLPDSASELLELANAGEAGFRRVDDLVRRTPELAAKILGTANSARFRPAAPVCSLRQAMMLLGWCNIRDVLWQVLAETHVFRGNGRKQLRDVRTHAVFVAHATRVVAGRMGLDTDLAFACGLLHDLGRPMTRQALEQIETSIDGIDREPIIDCLHTSVGERVASSWNFPQTVARVIGDHHRSPRPGLEPLVLAVAVAERLGAHHQVAGREGELDASDPVFATLGFTTEELDAMIGESGQLVALL